MSTVIIVLLSVSVILFILSFFQPDRVRSLEKELEQQSMNMLQEHYIIKKRLKILEEELLVEQNLSESLVSQNPEREPNEILKNHVIALYNQGLGIQQISKQSALPIETVENIIQKNSRPYGR